MRRDENGYTTKTINIGDWDMDTDTTSNVVHGLSATEYKTVRRVEAVIRNDADTTYYPLSLMNDVSLGLVSGSVQQVGSTWIKLGRYTSGLFNDTIFDATSYNRGFITFEYISD